VTGPELVLCGPEAAQVAAALELALRTRRRNGHAPGEELRQVAAKVAQAVPLVAACLPALLDAAGPEVAAMVRAQARGSAGSVARPRPAPLGSWEASRLAGTSARAVRSAAQGGRLVARKNQVTGEWLISPADLAEWMEQRSAA